MNIKTLYETNETFKLYVDKFARDNKISVERAFLYKACINYGEYLVGEPVNEMSKLR